MASTTRNPLESFRLTPQQQTLLFAALNSNKANAAQANNMFNLSPGALTESPVQSTDGTGFQESPYLDYDLDFGAADSSFDFSFDDANGAKMIGALPGTTDDGASPSSDTKSDSVDGDSPDKRSHPDDDDDEEQSGGGKRRESEEKVPKKPGRKPLTTEPSSVSPNPLATSRTQDAVPHLANAIGIHQKRKAQNRAAQRAFRERKEKHLKDLETKVDELEKASEVVNHENELLRAKVDKMTAELGEYKKRVSLMANSRSSGQGQGPPRPFGQSFVNNINDVNFQFEFPRFGALPGPNLRPAAAQKSSPPDTLNRTNSDHLSPREKSKDPISPSNSSTYSQVGLDPQAKEDLASLSASLFTPSLTNSNLSKASRTSLDSHYSMNGGTSTSSPSASSASNVGPSSSCGTSPEPLTQSPMAFKPLDTMSTIGEENSATNAGSQGKMT